MSTPLVIMVDAEDVGATQAIHFSVNQTRFLSLYAQTSHESRAIDTAQELLADALGGLLTLLAEKQGYRKYTDDDGREPV